MQKFFCVALINLVLVVGLVMPTLADDTKTPAQEAIKEAITILEAHLAQAEKKADQDKIADAIAMLQKLLPKTAAPEGKDAPPRDKLNITSAILKEKFQGNAAYDPKTGLLTLGYDFSSKDQLKDFDLNDSEPVVARGTLKLEGGEVIRHSVKFKTVTVNARCANRRGNNHPIITTTESYAIWITGDKMALHFKGNDVVENRLPAGRLWDVQLKVMANRIGLKAGDITLSKAVKTELAGNVEFKGGERGNMFSKVVIEGKVDEEWAKKFFVP
jgi:hypothetical protein